MIEHLLEEITERGWYVYQLREEPPERDPTFPLRWECHLRREAAEYSMVSHGEGQSLKEALELALDRIPNAEYVSKLVPPRVFDGEIEKPDLAAVRAQLLNQPSFVRRI